MYKGAFIDIVNICNANCPFCLTGKANRNGENKFKKLEPMTFEFFKKIIDHLLDNNIIENNSWIGLYNWYEPMLNPKLSKFINYLTEKGFYTGLSTNISVIPKFDENFDSSYIDEVIFSMPGFSQESYDRIHGFNFSKIKANIKQFSQFLFNTGFKGDMYIHFHVYQFNIHEAKVAKKFADELGINIKFTYAYFNNDEFRSYLDGSMTFERLREVSKDLFFCYIDNLFENKDKYKKAFQEPPILTISENGNLLISRNDNDESSIGCLFEYSTFDEIKNLYDKKDTRDEIDEFIQVWGQTFNIDISDKLSL